MTRNNFEHCPQQIHPAVTDSKGAGPLDSQSLPGILVAANNQINRAIFAASHMSANGTTRISGMSVAGGS
jgi:hypothetical protein